MHFNIFLAQPTAYFIIFFSAKELSWYVDSSSLNVHVGKLNNDEIVTVDLFGNLRFWETGFMQLQRSLDDWKKLVGKGKYCRQLLKYYVILLLNYFFNFLHIT